VAACVPMAATLLPLTLLLLSAAALVLKVVLSPCLHAGSGTSKKSKQPPGPRTSPHFKDGKPKASNSFPSSQQG